MTNDPIAAKFANLLAALQKQHASAHTFEGAHAYLNLHVNWADALVPTDKRGAIEHLAEAEKHQWTIGTFATGSGEGLESMLHVHELMARQAKLEESCADEARTPEQTRRHLQSALALWTEIHQYPKSQYCGEPAEPHLERLNARLAAR